MRTRRKVDAAWAVIAILLVCLAMAFTSGCKKTPLEVCKKTPLAVGQVWEDEPWGDPFKQHAPSRRKILALRDGYVEYELVGEFALGVVGSMSENIFRTGGAKLITGERPVEKITLTGRPEPDIPPQWGKGDIVAFPVPGEMPSYSIYETKTLVRTNGLNEATIELAPFPPGPWEPLGECQYCGRSFRGMTEQEMWRHGDTCPGLLDADHTGTTPVWGKGDLSAEHIKFFGESNGSRLDYIQNQTIGRHSEIIKEMAIRILILEGADPNDVRLGGAG